MMKKKSLILIFCMIISVALLAVGCAKDNPTPVENVGQSTTLVTSAAPTELTPYEVAYAYIQKQSEMTSYKIETVGAAKASVAGINYKNDVYTTTYKNGTDYLDVSHSSSILVDMKHQAFSKNGKVAYRDSFDGTIKVASRADYKSIYGVLPDDLAIGGFIFTEKTVRYAELLSTPDVNGALTYRYVLYGDKSLNNGIATASASQYNRYQTKMFGSLDNIPVFSDIEIFFTVKSDWTPVQYRVVCSYDFRMKPFGDITCSQDLLCTYSDVNTGVTIPGVGAFNSAIGAQPSPVTPDEKPEDALSVFMDIVDAFAEQDYEAGVKFGLNLRVGLLEGGNYLPKEPIAVDVLVDYNPEAIANKTFLDVVKFRISADLSPIQQLLGINTIKGLIPEDVAWLLKMYGVDIYYTGDGYPVIVLSDNDGNPTLVEKIDLAELLIPIISKGTLSGKAFGLGDIGNIDIMSVLETVVNVLDMRVTESGKEIFVKPDAEIEDQNIFDWLCEKYNGLFDEIAKLIDGDDYDPSKSSTGNTVAGLLNSMVGVKAISDIKLAVNETEGKITSLKLDVMGCGKDPTGKQGTTKNPISLISLEITLDGQLTAEEKASLDNDTEVVKGILAKKAAADAIRTKIDNLGEYMWLEDSYLASIDSLKAEIEALDAGVKSLVDNAYKLDGYITTRNTLKAHADRFIELMADMSNNMSELDSLYDEIQQNNCQRAYIGAELINQYLAAKENE